MLAVVGAVAVVGTWGTAPKLPGPRSAHAVLVAAGKIYVLGGPGSNRVDAFDGHAWKSATRLPEGIVNAPVAVAIGRKIYVLGGFLGSTNLPTDHVWIFDTTARRWSEGPPLPAPRGGAAAVVLDGRIHVLGGGNNESTLALHSVLDPSTGTWSEAAPLPRAEGSPAAVVRDGKILAIGGRSGFSDHGSTYVYLPAKDKWTKGPGIPPRGTAGATVWHDSIYLFGGESQKKAAVLNDVFKLGPRAKAWERVGVMPVARNYARAVVYRRRIYVVGGSTIAGNSHGATGSRIVEWFRPR